MSNKRRPDQANTGHTMPVKCTLVKVLSGLRKKNFQNSRNSQNFVPTGRHLLILGRLRNAWKDIVGVQLAQKTSPSRMINGKLYLTVSDSQWMHTLTFVKPKILEKLGERFPEFRISDIIGQPGKIPEEQKKHVQDSFWPDWNDFESGSLPETLDQNLSETIARCKKKLAARMVGLQKQGFSLCKKCNAAMTSSEEGVCAVCRFDQRSEILNIVRALMHEMPWLSLDEIQSCVGEIKTYEFEAIRFELLDECLDLIKEIGEGLKDNFEEKQFCQMKKEMVRAIMLHTGCMPNQVDLFNLSRNQILDEKWIDYLTIECGEE
ncbi:MAG: hypothetical protein Kow0029_00330 [Candidatus Rifleibacteriota bacterium]